MSVILLLVERLFRIRPPGLFALYVAYYSFGRLFEEQLRIDPSHEFLDQRLNFWVALVLLIAFVAFFVWWQFFRKHSDPSTDGGVGVRPQGPGDGRPQGSRPPLALASGGCCDASSTSTSRRSRARSTCC